VKAAGKFLKRRALSLFFLRKIRQSTMRTTAIAFAPVKFAFLIQGAISNAPLRSTRRIENCRINLNDESRGNDVSDRQAIDFPPLQLLEKAAHRLLFEVLELDSTIAEDLNSSSLRRTRFGTQSDDAESSLVTSEVIDLLMDGSR
jgi:hypothetical protein